MAAFVDALVGRRRELEHLERTLEDVEADAVRVLALSSEAGIGKTRLLYELVQWESG
jgi:predicted ATPase